MNGKQVKRALSLLALTLLMLGAAGANGDETTDGTTVMLGTSGASVTLTMSDGQYRVTGSEMVTSIVTGPDGTPQGALAANGNMYTLMMDDHGHWTATFMAPDPVSVMLGASGDSVSVQLAEDGSYMMDGAAVMDGDTVMADNGNTYMLSMADGAWMAMFVPAEASVTLGITGEMVTLMTSEDGSYWLGDMAVEDGSTTMSSNGNVYTLMMGDDGTWMATYTAPEPATVALGTSGASVTFRRNENGSYSPTNMSGVASYSDADGMRMVVAANGNSYTLTVDDDGMWMASYNMPAAQSVMLGMSGASVDVTKAEDGSYWVGTDELMDGDTRVAGDNTYRLTMMDGMWMAEYVPAMVSVTLGTSGDSAELTRAEDGGYWLGDMALMDGSTTMAANGNTYSLSMDADGNWMATFVAPEPMTVALGKSGDTVSISMNEARMYMIGEMEVMDGSTYTSGAGNSYTLMMGEDGMFTAMYNGEETMVALGTSGSSATLVKQEDGSYAMDGKAFESGMTATADNGMVYVLSMDADGMWMAAYVTNSQMVTLGISGSVTLTQAEDGSWSDGETAVMSGSEVTAENGNKFLLSQDSEGVFTASYQAVTMEILGTGLLASEKEDGTGYDVSGAMLDKTGTGDVTVAGAMYHVWMDGETMMGARFDDAIHGDSAGDSAVEAAFVIVGGLQASGQTGATGSAMVPTLSADDEDTVGNELRTSLSIAGQTYSIADLLGPGTAAAKGNNYVADAHAEITKVRGDVNALLSLDSEPTGLIGILNTAWIKVQTEVSKVFGAGVVDLGTRPIDDNLLSEIDEILAALSNGSSFAAATMDEGGGVFEAAKLSEENALKAFDATDTESTVIFGTTGPTRYGAVAVMSREVATDDPDYNWGTGADAEVGNGDADELGLVGAFSYSTIDDLQRTHYITHTGAAYYEGGTVATSGSGKLYTGDIAIEVRFASGRVSGLVTNLMSTDGDPWTYQYGQAESIILPTTTSASTSKLTNQGHWSAVAATSAADNAAQVTFEQRAGSTAPVPIAGTFQGQLLGKGDDSGSHAHGTWSIGAQTESGSPNYLAGAFGAERQADTPTVKPGQDDGSVHETLVTSNSNLAADAARPNAFALDSGDLVVTMNKTARYRADATSTIGTSPNTQTVYVTKEDPDGVQLVVNNVDDTLLVDQDTTATGNQYPTEDLKRSLATMVGNHQVEGNVNGGKKQREIFVAAIETLRADLVLLQGLDTRVPTSEQAVWDKVQEATLRIFSYVPEKLSGTYDEDDALGLIDQVLYAFESQANLEAALDRDGKGIFNNVWQRATNTDTPSASLIWGRQEVQMKVQGGKTDYTRWGVWRVRQDSFAARDRWDNFTVDTEAANGNDPGAFAYSPLTQTTWADEDDPGFPGGGSASFMGETTAITGTAIYEGTAEVHVAWDATWDGTTTDVLGVATLRLVDLITTNNGDALSVTAGDVSLITMSVDINRTETNTIEFNSTSVTATSWGGAFGLDNRNVGGTSEVAARFLGQDAEGPLAVMGTYKIAGYGTGLVGAFGADRP